MIFFNHHRFLFFLNIMIWTYSCYSDLNPSPECFFEDELFFKNPDLKIETQRCCTTRVECRQAFHDAIDNKILKVKKDVVDSFVSCEPAEDLQYGICVLKTTQENSQCRDDLDCKTSLTSPLTCNVVDDERCIETFGEAFEMSTSSENTTQKRCTLCL